MRRIAKRAREASYVLGTLEHKKRNAVLWRMAAVLEHGIPSILRANSRDVARAGKMGLSNAMIGRLKLDSGKIKAIAHGLRDIAKLADPLNRVLEVTRRPNGLCIEKVSVPLGVLLIIYESRPNVTADCAGLGVKSGNSVILKGGKEAFESNRAIHACLRKALAREGVPAGAVECVPSTDRRDVHALLRMRGMIDLVIPRGGEGLIRKVAQISRIPMVKHDKGICHVYVDGRADIDMALKIAENAKVQNPGVCNAMETLLVDRKIARDFLPLFGERMKLKGVQIRGCSLTKKILKGVRLATEKDWGTEYLDLILAVRVVDGVEAAIRHIQSYGSSHSDAIVSRDPRAVSAFTKQLDSACVFVNTSTRFSDGGEFGMGAEVGISTDKIHARGPMGLRELATYKYVVKGNGQVRR